MSARIRRAVRIGVRPGSRGLGFQVGDDLVSHFFGLGDLLFELANVGMAVRVVRAEICQLRSEFVQFLVDRG